MELELSKNGEVTTLSLRGRLDAATSAAAQEQVLRIIDEGNLKLIMDLAQVSYVSSAGLRVFMTAGKRVKGKNGKMIFCSLQEQTKELFEFAGFSSIFVTCATQAEALQSLGA
jgi:anti-anti-sigma factor